MSAYGVPVWKKTPFLRIFPALAAGMILQWYGGFSDKWWWWLMLVCFFLLLCSFTVPLFSLFTLSWIAGIAITLLLISAGAIRLRQQDIRNDPHWIGSDSITPYYIVKLDGDPEEKPKTFQANATVIAGVDHGGAQTRKGRLVLYFRKDSLFKPPPAGSLLLLRQKPEPVRNSGNPGGFDYQRYLLFQDITHQIYLQDTGYLLLNGKDISRMQNLVHTVRRQVLSALKKYIPHEPEQGLAEALLVGYKNDLDKDLVQSYSNTGVVHIIAISGLHLGLIYGLLSWLCIPLKKNKRTRWAVPVIILCGLWLFSLVAGASPSVLRSALMFSCLLLGRTIDRKSSMLNSMAVSATILIWLNPFCLWDAGFQLSYAAVLSIILFMKPVYNLLYFQNKLMDAIWKLAAISIAAQILTTPVSLYLFHQFPLYFLLTNVLAVPLSSLIVLGEILLLVLSMIPVLAIWTGKLLIVLISWMNSWIRQVEALPFSTISQISVSIIQVLFLYGLIVSVFYGLRDKNKKAVWLSGICLLSVLALGQISRVQSGRQQLLIVYNIPQQTVIDYYSGKQVYCIADPALLQDLKISRYDLKPARDFFHCSPEHITIMKPRTGLYRAGPLKILLLDQPAGIQPATDSLDLLILSGRQIKNLPEFCPARQIICTTSIPRKRAAQLKAVADSLHIPMHIIAEDGAFVMRLN